MRDETHTNHYRPGEVLVNALEGLTIRSGYLNDQTVGEAVTVIAEAIKREGFDEALDARIRTIIKEEASKSP